MATTPAPRSPADLLGRFGDRPALLFEGSAISYDALDRRVEERAAQLGPGRRLVMLSGGNDVETVVSYLGALRGGHVPWLVPKGPNEELVERFDPDVVVSRCAGFPVIRHRRAGSVHRLHPDLALLLGTSGSTGAPRLVRLSHDNLMSNAEAIADYLGITRADRAITTLPLHYCYGLSVLHSHLARGASLTLTDASVADAAFWDLLRDSRATSFAGVPHTFELLDRVGFASMDLPSLRYVTQAGGRLAPDAVRRFASLGARKGWELVVMYGQTEATARMAYLPPDLALSHPGTIGVPIPGGAFEIASVPEVADPEVGELVYRGPNVMLGYADGPADLERGRDVEELRTGDLARRGSTGLVEVVGRRSRFLKLYGLRVDLDEVERILDGMGHDAVAAGSDELLTVGVVGEPCPGLARLLGERLGIPSASIAVHALEAVPRLPNGKPDREAVAALSATEREGASRPATDDVAAAFRRVLDRDRVEGGDSFSSLGGDSLSYVEMSLALEETLGHLPADWPSRTVDELSGMARTSRRGSEVETNVLLRAGAILLVVASHLTAFWPAGGAHLLLALAGHSFARFQLASDAAEGRFRRGLATVGRIGVPSVAWIAVVAFLGASYGLGTVFLLNGYAGSGDVTNGQWHYWFIEAMVIILLALALLFSVRWVRNLERRHPYLVALALLGAALAIRFAPVSLLDDGAAVFRPHSIVWVFILGWLVHRSVSLWQRGLTSAIVVATVPGFFGDGVREAIITGGLLLLLWVPTLVVPRAVGRLAGVLAAASLFIYLTHWQVWPAIDEYVGTPLVFVGAVVAGVAVWWLFERASGWIGLRTRRRGSSQGRVAGADLRPPPEKVATHGRS